MNAAATAAGKKNITKHSGGKESGCFCFCGSNKIRFAAEINVRVLLAGFKKCLAGNGSASWEASSYCALSLSLSLFHAICVCLSPLCNPLAFLAVRRQGVRKTLSAELTWPCARALSLRLNQTRRALK